MNGRRRLHGGINAGGKKLINRFESIEVKTFRCLESFPIDLNKGRRQSSKHYNNRRRRKISRLTALE